MEHADATTDLRGLSINIHANPRRRDLIDRAARAVVKSRSEFMPAASCREAEEVLLDRRFVQLDAEALARFAALLDGPPPTEELRRLLLRKAPWE